MFCAEYYFRRMLTQEKKIGLKLWIQITLLALVMPVAGAFTGWYYSLLVAETGNPLYSAILGAVIGILVDVVCYYENLFSLVFYKLPIPVVMFFIFNEFASFFFDRLTATAIGIGGAALGVLIVWVLIIPNPFYTVRKRVLILVYIFLSLIMLGLMQGVPVSNFLLGILAGNYFSLRYVGSVMSRTRLRRNLRAVTIMAATVLLLSELIFAWLIWQDSVNILNYLYDVFGVRFSKLHLMLMIDVFGVLSVIIQLFITYSSAIVMYRYRSFKSNINP